MSLLLRVSLLRFLCLSSATAAATLDGRDPRRQNEARAALMDSLLVLDSSAEEPSGCRAPPRVGASKTSRWSFGLLATPRHPEWRAEPPPAGARRPAHLPVVEVDAIVVSGGLCPVPPRSPPLTSHTGLGPKWFPALGFSYSWIRDQLWRIPYRESRESVPKTDSGKEEGGAGVGLRERMLLLDV